MWNKFPDKKKGDRLSHQHVNLGNTMGRKTSSFMPRGFVDGMQAGNIMGLSSSISTVIRLMRITANNGNGTFNGTLRQYSPSSETWEDVYVPTAEGTPEDEPE